MITEIESSDKLQFVASFFDNLDSAFWELAGGLASGLLASYLLGIDQVRSEKAAPVSFADPIEMGFDVAPDDAIDYFKKKRVVTSRQFDRLADDARSAAFTVGGVYKQDILQGFKSEIVSALENGTPQQTVVNRFKDLLAGAGHRELGNFHLETVFRTNMQMAYGVGRRKGLEAVAADLPFWTYHTVGDDRVRPTHAVLNGITFPSNHEFWDTHFPPWDFNCRCSVTAAESTEAGYDHSNPSGEGKIFYDNRGMPAKAEIGTSVYDLAVGDFRGVPPQGGLKTVIEKAAKQAAKPSLRDRLDIEERSLLGLTTEKAIVLDRDGSVLIERSDNDPLQVGFSAEEVRRFEGKLFTHNHPLNGSFSLADGQFAVRANLGEIRAVDGQYRYSLKPSAGGWKLSAEQLADLHRATSTTAMMEFLPRIRSGKMSLNEAEELLADKVWRDIAKSAGWHYRREKW